MKRKRRQQLATAWGWLLRLAVMVLIWGLLGAVVYFLVMPLFVRTGREVATSGIVGLAEDSAQAKLDEAGFGLVVDDRRLDTAVPEGHIITQHPQPGRQTKPGRRIHVIVSDGAIEAYLPDVRGSIRQDAIARLQRMGMELNDLRYAFSDTYLEKQVISQHPPPDTKLTDENRVATLTISLGGKPESFEAPNLLGMAEEDARFLIRKAGLTLGMVSFERLEYEPEGVILQQAPEPGTVLEEGAKLSLVINQKEANKANTTD